MFSPGFASSLLMGQGEVWPHFTDVETEAGEVKSPGQGHPDRKRWSVFPARPSQLRMLTSKGHPEASGCLSWEPPFLAVVLAPGPVIGDGPAL